MNQAFDALQSHPVDCLNRDNFLSLFDKITALSINKNKADLITVRFA